MSLHLRAGIGGKPRWHGGGLLLAGHGGQEDQQHQRYVEGLQSLLASLLVGRHAGAEGAPDLVIEILSAKTAKLDRKLKIRVYARTGVKELWLVDPDLRVVEIFDLPKDSQQPAAIHRENDRFTSSFFPGLAFEVSIFFKR